MSSFKSSENIQKKEGGPDRSVSDNQFSSVTLNELAMKARKSYCNFKFQKTKIKKVKVKSMQRSGTAAIRTLTMLTQPSKPRREKLILHKNGMYEG